MASADKIYGTQEQYDKLIDFLEHHEEDYIKFTGNKWRAYIKGEGDDIAILNTSTIDDLWLTLHCKLELCFVLDRIREMYNIKDCPHEQLVIQMWDNALDSAEHDMCEELYMYEEHKKEWLRVKRLYEKF